jgi:hypothetical protein
VLPGLPKVLRTGRQVQDGALLLPHPLPLLLLPFCWHPRNIHAHSIDILLDNDLPPLPPPASPPLL